jgi:DNA-directed RNA polymerase II subunit RPB2
LFWASTYKTHTEEEKKEGYITERIGIPPCANRKHDCNYGLLDENGIVYARHPKWVDKDGKTHGGDSVYVQKGDVIIGKVLVQSDKDGNEELNDCSYIIKKGDEGYIDRIFTTITPNGYKLVKVIIRKTRVPEIGDKFASRSAQKGTCGMVYRQEDMPFTSEGITPDIIINPHCIPSRMTINQLMETVLGKSCAMEGTFGDATPFTSSSIYDEDSNKTMAEKICDRLGMNGYQRNGNELLYNGMTGEKMGMYFVGPVYYQRLKHLVNDKEHARAYGPLQNLIRQPTEGRARDGGLRLRCSLSKIFIRFSRIIFC